MSLTRMVNFIMYTNLLIFADYLIGGRYMYTLYLPINRYLAAMWILRHQIGVIIYYYVSSMYRHSHQDSIPPHDYIMYISLGRQHPCCDIIMNVQND